MSDGSVVLVNHTKKPIKFVTVDGKPFTLQPTEPVARIVETVEYMTPISTSVGVLSHARKVVKDVIVPDEKEGHIFIVPHTVWRHLRDERSDLRITAPPKTIGGERGVTTLDS